MDFLQSVGLLDIVFIVILVVSVLLGVIRGAIREILSLVGLAAAIYLAFKFSDLVSKEYVSKFFEQEKISYVISFVLIIVGTVFAIALFNLLVSQLLKASGLSSLNRFFGLLFGALRGVVLCSILVMIIGFVPGVNQEKWWAESSLAPFFKTISSKAMEYVPDNVAQYVESTKNTITTAAGQNSKASDANKADGSMRPQAGDDKVVKNILQSIDGSLQETKKPNIQLETSTQENKTTKSANNEKKTKLVLESYD